MLFYNLYLKKVTLPVSYLVYGSALMVLIAVILYLINKQSKR